MLRHVNGSIRCMEEAFGDDPRPNFAKMCSCRTGPAWPTAVVDGLNSMIARRLMLRVEAGPPGASCSPEDDESWTACSVLATRYDSSFIPDRQLPQLPPDEQQDATLRKLDICHGLAGKGHSLRVIGISPSSLPFSLAPVKAEKAPVCAVVYDASRGPLWDGRQAVFCPTEPPRCLEGSCECAEKDRSPVDLRALEGKSEPACWTCLSQEQRDRVEAAAKEAQQKAEKSAAPAAAAQGLPLTAWAAASGARPERPPAGRTPVSAAYKAAGR